MQKRILQIIPTLDRGGAEKQMTLLASGLPTSQFDVHVCTLTRSGPLESDLNLAGIPTTNIGKSWKVDPFAYARLKKLVRKLKPDIVHTWLFAANSYGRQAAFSTRVPTVIAGERCVDPWKASHQFMIDRHLSKRTKTIVTNTQAVVDFYSEHGIGADHFTVIPNGVQIPTVPSKRSREDLLTEFGIPANARLIATVARLWPQKRLKDLIWASDLLKTIRDDTHLLIIGDGPQRWRLERFRDQTDLIGRTHFLGVRDDVVDILPHLDCFWLGSGYEGQSNAILEAMANGIPVVASDIPGNKDLVVPEETGYLVPVGDRAALAKWTNVLLDDPDKAQAFGSAGRERVAADFSVEQMIQRHVDLYLSDS